MSLLAEYIRNKNKKVNMILTEKIMKEPSMLLMMKKKKRKLLGSVQETPKRIPLSMIK